MIHDYISNKMKEASYEIIDNGKRFYAEIKAMRGVWAVGRTLEECRQNLLETIEGWLILRLKKNLPIQGLKTSNNKHTPRYA